MPRKPLFDFLGFMSTVVVYNEMEDQFDFIPRNEGQANGMNIKAIKAAIQDIILLWFQWVLMGKRGRIQKSKIYRVGGSEPA